jgi:ActR/RegA family two-component response regulator
MSILLVTPRARELAAFAQALGQGCGLPVNTAATWDEALAMVKAVPPAFAVLDQGLAEGEPLALATKFLMVNAMVNLAVVSNLGAEEFHEASEGLGILAPVPVNPTAADGAALAEVFRRFL